MKVLKIFKNFPCNWSQPVNWTLDVENKIGGSCSMRPSLVTSSMGMFGSRSSPTYVGHGHPGGHQGGHQGGHPAMSLSSLSPTSEMLHFDLGVKVSRTAAAVGFTSDYLRVVRGWSAACVETRAPASTTASSHVTAAQASSRGPSGGGWSTGARRATGPASLTRPTGTSVRLAGSRSVSTWEWTRTVSEEWGGECRDLE